MDTIAFALLTASVVGLLAVAAQHLVLWHHVRQAPRLPRREIPVSILKPLCGVDDGLAENLASFARIAHGEYEVLLGLRSPADPALPYARDAVRRWPGRFRIVYQRGEAGLNPKVNQLVGLARAARHDVLVVSDSNVRVEPGYLAEIAALLEDPAVGLVTHPIAGVGEERLGALLDHLHLAGAITPGVVAAQRLAGRPIVVGKSMAFRRADLVALGGFESVKDVLAEDYVLGARVGRELGKRVAVATAPVSNVGAQRSVAAFAARYARWAVLQRQAVGAGPYAAMLLLNPVLLSGAAAALAPGRSTAIAFLAVCAAKASLDGAGARVLRPGGFRIGQLAAVPLKDLVFGAAFLRGLVRRDVVWRGTRLVVTRGTRIEALPGMAPPDAAAPGAGAASPAA